MSLLLPLSGPHLHILLVHVPILGFIITTIWLALAIQKNNSCHQKTSLIIMFGLYALTIPTFISGAASRWSIQSMPNLDIDVGLIFLHQNIAFITFCFASIAGTLSWFALWVSQRRIRHFYNVYSTYVPSSLRSNGNIACKRLNSLIVAFGALTSWFAIKAGSIGGNINHPEVRSGLYEGIAPTNLNVAGNPGGIIDSAFNLILGGDQFWRWPAFEALHFLGMALLFGVVFIIGLRVLGFAKDSLSYASVHRLLPIAMFGLIVNIGTGFLFFIGDSARYVNMPGFPYKMAAIVIAMIASIYFTVNRNLWNLQKGDDATIESKSVSILFLLSWGTVIFFGRQLPYIFGGG
jgi:hypothetical protein